MHRSSDEKLVQAFRHCGPYLKHHRGSTFVIMIPGATVESSHLDDIIGDIALLQSLDIKLVLVFGAREQIDAALTRNNINARFYNRIRIADDETFEVIKNVCGQMQIDLTSKLSMGLVNTPMQGSRLNVISGNFVTSRPIGVVDGIDYMHSGIIRRVDAENILREINNHSIVLISPVGYSITGECFSVNSEEVAAKVAVAIKANKLITFCSNDELLVNEQGEVIAELFPDEAQQYLEKIDKDVHNSTYRYLKASVFSCNNGVERCHLVSHEQDGAIIQELFTRDGIGTQIVKQSAASAALYCYEEKKAELACVAIHPDYRGSSRGDVLINKIEELAKSKGMKELFVLTTKSAHFFLEKGFIPGKIEDLPAKKRAHYNYQRMSKILFRKIKE